MKGEQAEVELQLSLLENETLIWQQGPTIGSGRFGQVALALRIPSAELLAVKQILIQEEVGPGNDTSALCIQRTLPRAVFEREADIVESIQHPNVVRFVGCECYGSVYRIFMEYVPAGSLSKILKEHGPFGESAARHLIRQLTDGVSYLHRLGIAHRDLKCANLLLADDGTVKIADFGSAKRGTAAEMADEEADEFARERETARSVRDGLGSPYWMAPELVRAERGDDNWRKADVWAIGCVLIELVTARPPWDNHSNPMTAMFHIASKDAVPASPTFLSESAKAFLSLCFDKSPVTRPPASDLLTHPFLKGDSGPLSRWTDESPIPFRLGSQLKSPGNHELGDQIRSRSSFSANSESSDCRSRMSETFEDVSEAANIDAEYSSDETSGDDVATDAVISSELKVLGMHGPAALPFPKNEIGRVRALADYLACDINELSLKEGEELIVLGVNEFGWWGGMRARDDSSEMGWFPCTYVEWIPAIQTHTTMLPHTTDSNAEEHGSLRLLSLSVGDEVHIVHCEWREETIWAYGSVESGAVQGWFPFMCVVDESG